VTTQPATFGSPDNCAPFGRGIGWTPYAGFVYKNLPAFQLKTGDTIGFDLGAMNDADIQLEIALAAATVNGGDIPAQPFTTVVTNTQTPLNPRGDTTPGTFELRFTAQAPFNFAGGGLIIRFSSPSASYATDMTCTPVEFELVSASDASGFFVERFYQDTDGASPWSNTEPGPIVPVQFTLADLPVTGVTGVTGPTGQRAAALKKCKKKAHRNHWTKKKLRKCKKKAKLLPV
jgi:hypothetical protein